MEKIQSKLTSQGQVSVPAPIRSFLNLKPGSVLVWSQEGGRVVVERATRYGTQQVHEALFPEGKAPSSPAKTLVELKEGLRQRMQSRYAGR